MTGGLVQNPGANASPGITSAGPQSPETAPMGATSTPRITVDLEGHSVVLTGEDLLMLSVLVLLFTDIVLAAAEVMN
jgi:hypothetical protein